jgi:hypothetical protein
MPIRMDDEEIAGEIVDQITPKGNSLVLLARGGGDPTSEKVGFKDLVLVPGLVKSYVNARNEN